MGRFDSDSFAWPGLGSANRYSWQEGLRFVASEMDGCLVVTSKDTNSGYDYWEHVVEAILRNGLSTVFLAGHSNGVIACERAALALKPHGVNVWYLCMDHTMKSGEPIGSNVTHAMELWAGPPMSRMKLGSDFNGKVSRHEFRSESHIGMTHDDEVLSIASRFAKSYRAENKRFP